MHRLLSVKLFFCFHIYAVSSYAAGTNQYKFIENKGQLPANVYYSTSVESGKIYFEKNCLTYDFADVEKIMHPHINSEIRSKNISAKQYIQRHTYKVYFESANNASAIKTSTPTETRYNYFYGKEESKWISNVKAYEKITYTNIYKNINATYYTSSSQTLKYDFTLLPGANADDIKLRYEGVNTIKLANGNLIITTSLNQVTEQKPYAYQIISGRKITVPCNYALDDNTLSFSLPQSYNKALPLIIDPEIIFSTYSGSKADNFGFCAAYDKYGNAYSGGIAFSSGFPVTVGAYQQTFGGGINNMEIDEIACDVSILKFSPDGKKLLYATYLGSNGNEKPQSMIVNSKNQLIILGNTNASNFPVTSNSFDTSYNNKSDFFISKISENGSNLISSTYFGGNGIDGINKNFNSDITLQWLNNNYGDELRSEVQVDKLDNIIFASSTQSEDFPIKNANQKSLLGNQDAVVVKLNKNLDSLIFSTYLGGDSLEAAYGIAINEEDASIYVCGGTTSYNFPVDQYSYSSYYAGKTDGFIAHFLSNGKLRHSTYLNTAAYDQAYLIKYFSDFVYVTGQTRGYFPVSSKVYSNANSAQFISIVTSDLNAINKSTVFGSGRNLPDIVPTAFGIDKCGKIYVAGWGGDVNSTSIGYFGGSMLNLPITNNAFQKTTDGSDFYMAVFASNFDTLLYGSYYGGGKSAEHNDGGQSRFDEHGMLYLTACGGCGGYSDWPTTDSAWSKVNKGKRPNMPNSGGCNQALLKMNLNTSLDFGYDFEAGKSDIKFFAPEAISYSWNFGDGTTSTERNPHKQFTVGKTYHVCLTITTNCEENTICKEVKIWNTGIAETQITNISIYPNPAQNFASLKIDDDLFSKHFPLILYMADNLGREIMKIDITTSKSDIRLDGLAGGLYYYTLKSNDEILTKGKLSICK